MEINRATLNAFFVGMRALFDEAAAGASTDYLKFTTEISSSTAIEIFRFLQRFGGMREWVGERVINNFASGKLDVVNRDFEDTVAVARNDYEDDLLAQYAAAIRTMGQGSKELWRDLAVEALVNGAAAVWLDGLNFFSTARKYGKNTINNKGTAALSAAAYKSARATMFKYKDATGKNGKVRPTLLLVGPDNEDVAFGVLQNELTLNIANGTTATAAKNPWAGKSEYLVLPELGSEWFLLDNTRPTKPIIVQKRREPVLVAKDQPTDDNVFFKKEYIYGCDGRGAAFLSLPHLIYGSFPA
ncbi:MAG: Mu-like prophage major head subunit gpT family protein [Victivallaceae bacterium]|nr:Mu-like prophage major head subunit gpT family protein [Victivallaceae bacterium]